MRVKVSDYLVSRLHELTGSRHCFFLSGGGIMHLCDSLGSAPDITPVPMHHEQAASIAADACGRVHNTIGICFVTTGPGGTNAVTGVAGAWQESTPLLVVSGQVSRANWRGNSGIRQMGIQEVDIVPIVQSITKYAAMVLEPTEIRYHLEKAVFLARYGRPGPVLLDIPLDVQGATVEASELKGFDPAELPPATEPLETTRQKVRQLVEMLRTSKRPVLLGGHGVILSGARDLFKALVNRLNVPTQTSWSGIDLLEEQHPLNFGRTSVFGPRYSAFVVQNCDLLLSIGSRLGLQQIGYNHKAFAREAKQIMVDLDPHELSKHTVHPDVPVQADAKVFIQELLEELDRAQVHPQVKEWTGWCRQIKSKYPICGPEYSTDEQHVDPYVFADKLSEATPPGALIIPGSSGTGFTVTSQSFRIKTGQRFIISKGLSAMGYGLPSSIGGCFAHDKRDVITVIGDGGFQLNIQELQTIAHHRLPIKMFILNNQGYLSIKVTQTTYFNRRFVGSEAGSGVSLPDLKKIAWAYGLEYARIENHKELPEKLNQVLHTDGPVLCEVIMAPEKAPLPKLASYRRTDGTMASKPLEDLLPLLPRDEFMANMLVKPWDES